MLLPKKRIFLKSSEEKTDGVLVFLALLNTKRNGFLPLPGKFEPHCLLAIRIFFSVLAAIIRKSSDQLFEMTIVKALPFIYQPDRVAPKASDVSAAG